MTEVDSELEVTEETEDTPADDTPTDETINDEVTESLIELIEILKEKETDPEEENEDITTLDDILEFFENEKKEKQEIEEQKMLLLETQNEEMEEEEFTIMGKMDEIIQQQLETNQKMDDLAMGANTMTTYGILYIPFAIIVFLLWRFFSTFLKTIR